jgi:hypothetical protein
MRAIPPYLYREHTYHLYDIVHLGKANRTIQIHGPAEPSTELLTHLRYYLTLLRSGERFRFNLLLFFLLI